MAEHKLFNTKILLRNDTIEKWQSSSLQLGKGEVALSWENGNCKLKVGDGTKTWSELDYLALDESQISSFLTTIESDISALEDRATALETDVSTLSSNAKSYQLSAVGQTVYLMETIGDGAPVATATSFTIPTVPSTDEYSEINPLATKQYVDDISASLDEYITDEIADVRSQLSSAWQVKGVISVDTFPGSDFTAVPEDIYAVGEEPKDGDIVINKNIEYVWANGKWNELGNEGNYAVKGAIVDADIADDADIDQTKIASSQGNANLAEDLEKMVFNAYSFDVPATDISTLADIIDANESTLSAANKGDIIIINSKNPQDFGRQSFVFAGVDPLSASSWETLSEKYDANNVYFKNDITAMYKFGKYESASTTSPTTISCAGKSVAELFEDALTKIIEPSKQYETKPYVSITGGSTLTGEMGAVALTAFPKVTLSYEDGKYTYGPEPTGAKLSAYSISCNISATYGTWPTVSETFTSADYKGTGTIKTVNSSALTKNYVFGLSAQTFTFTAYNCKHTAGNRQWNNLKKESTKYLSVINAATADNKSTTVSISAGFYPTYEIIKATTWKDPSAITSADIMKVENGATSAQSGVTRKVTSSAVNNFKRASYTSLNSAMQQWFWIAKHGQVSKIAVTQKSPEAPHTVKVGKLTL